MSETEVSLSGIGEPQSRALEMLRSAIKVLYEKDEQFTSGIKFITASVSDGGRWQTAEGRENPVPEDHWIIRIETTIKPFDAHMIVHATCELRREDNMSIPLTARLIIGQSEERHRFCYYPVGDGFHYMADFHPKNQSSGKSATHRRQ